MDEQFDDLLKGLDPLDEDQLNRSISHLDADPRIRRALDGTPGTQPEARPGSFERLRSAPVLIPAVALAVVILLVAALVGPFGHQGGDDDIVSLRDVAGIAAAQAEVPLAGRIAYIETSEQDTRTTALHGSQWTVVADSRRQRWIAPDGSGRDVLRSSSPRFFTAADKRAWIDAGSPPFLAHGFQDDIDEQTFPAGTFVGLEEAATLPTTVGGLSELIRERTSRPGDDRPQAAAELVEIASLLRNPATPPEVRSKLYLVAAEIPGLRYFGDTTDMQGRDGQEVGVFADYSGVPRKISFVFDPETSAILGYRAVSTHPEDPDLTPQIEKVDFLRTGFTDSLDSPPSSGG